MERMMSRKAWTAWGMGFFLLLTGCQTAYFSAMEKIGYHKRDILVSRVEEARTSQQEAKEQFQTALQKFTELTGFKGGSLEDKYQKLNSEYENSKTRAEAVRNRIAAVEDVAEALFAEWKNEIGQYSNAGLRQSSERKFDETRQHYSRLIAAMKKAESKIPPVLTAFNDQVLYLKHNLNAQAIAALRDELATVETDIGALIRDMESSIREADSFLNAMARE